MINVEIYTTETCPYCVRAKSLLSAKGLVFQEIRVDTDEQQKEIMLQKSKGRRTVPQIFINEHHIGGCDDLYHLDQTGELERLIARLKKEPKDE